MKISCVYLCFLSLALSFVGVLSWPPPLYEGSACKHTTGEDGICKKIHECDPIINKIREHPSYDNVVRKGCRYQDNIEIVCCPFSTSTVQPIDKNSHPTFPPIENSRRAEKACSNYTLRKNNKRNALENHIINGIAAEENEFPYMAALGYRSSNSDGENTINYDCGGTLVSLQYILTAAHCVSNLDERVPVQARLGSVNLHSQSENVQEIRIKNQIVHPEYRRSRGLFDIALLQLENPVRWTPYVQPICLQTQALKIEKAGSYVVAGWGVTDDNGRQSEKLLKTQKLTLMSSKQCESFYAGISGLFPDGLGDHTFCAKDANTNRQSDTCQGDSGGPLVNTEDKNGVLIGVTSFGQFCNSPAPSGYMSVFPFLDWIEEIVTFD